MRYLLQRLLQLVIVFVLVTFGVMIIMRIGSNTPEEMAIKLSGGPITDVQQQALISRYKLDSNYLVQYWTWLWNLIVHQDLGESPMNSTTVWKLMQPRVVTTFLLGIYANIVALVLAVPLAVRQAQKRDSRFDKTGNFMTFIGVGIPAVVLGVLLQWVFALKLQWCTNEAGKAIACFPFVADKVYPWDNLGDHIKNFLLPTLSLAIPIAAVYGRLLRSDMVQTLQSDFVTLASAKGVPPRRVLWRHALRNSSLSLLTAVGTQTGALLGGALVVETLYDLDGLGSLLVVSVLASDLFTVQSFVAIIVLLVVVVNFTVDISYALVDPRIRQARTLV
ncbi:MAG: ABC transporter permease [Ilumatobacteraceae bacterium]